MGSNDFDFALREKLVETLLAVVHWEQLARAPVGKLLWDFIPSPPPRREGPPAPCRWTARRSRRPWRRRKRRRWALSQAVCGGRVWFVWRARCRGQ